jgi:imidazolonepropionase-like amidohydrolase
MPAFMVRPCVVLTLSALVIPVALGAPEARPPESAALTNVTVVDVQTGQLLPERTVVIEGGRIQAVGATSEVALPTTGNILDGTGKFLIPGLWDMHTHLLWSLDTLEHSLVDMPRDLDSWELWKRYSGPVLDLLVANGVTGIREMWGNFEVARRVEQEGASGDRLVPRVVVAGHMIDGEPPYWPGEVVATTPRRGREVVDSLAAAGTDFIKVYSHLRPEVYHAILERAAERGLPVVGHIPVLVSAAAASEAGQRAVEHLFGIEKGCSSAEEELIDLERQILQARSGGSEGRRDSLSVIWYLRVLETQDDARCRRLLRRLARNRTWQIPTLTTLRGLAYQTAPAMTEDPRLRYVHPGWRESWIPLSDPPEGYQLRRRLYERKLEITRMAMEEGVPILAGSDTWNPYAFPGFGLHDELELLAEAGLSPLQALQSATIEAARFLAAQDSLGTVAEGKVADLVLLDSNPLEDIRNARHIAAVVHRGRVLQREELDEMLESVESAFSDPGRPGGAPPES